MLMNTGAESNPARVIAREVRHVWNNVNFQMLKDIGIVFGIKLDTMTSPNQYSLELRGSRTTVQLVLPIRSDH
jgi:hypothetical protein